MRKYSNVDVIAALGAVVELNTEYYKSDFRYDIEQFKEAARNPDGENNRLLWLSRQSGTWSFPERDIYIKDTAPFHSFTGYGTLLGSPEFYQTVVLQDRILAYAVDITGIENGRVKGDLYELDYRDQIRQINKNALPLHTVTAKYEDGTVLTMPHKEHDAQRERLYFRHGQITDFKRHPENESELRDVVAQARERREKDARPAAFKVGVRHPKQQKQPQQPSIKDKIAAGKKQLAAERAAAPARAAAKSINTGLGD
jgi:hypothetical protein